MRRTHPVAQSGGVEIQHYRCTCVGPQGFGTHDLSVACAGQLLLVRVSGARCPRAHPRAGMRLRPSASSPNGNET